jgi:hypothetical protein
MKPEWFSLDKIPYEQMWESDEEWLKRVLNWEYVEYYFEQWMNGKLEIIKKIK